MKIEYTKEMIESMIDVYGKEKAIDEIVASFKVILEQAVLDLHK